MSLHGDLGHSFGRHFLCPKKKPSTNQQGTSLPCPRRSHASCRPRGPHPRCSRPIKKNTTKAPQHILSRHCLKPGPGPHALATSTRYDLSGRNTARCRHVHELTPFPSSHAIQKKRRPIKKVKSKKSMRPNQSCYSNTEFEGLLRQLSVVVENRLWTQPSLRQSLLTLAQPAIQKQTPSQESHVKEVDASSLTVLLPGPSHFLGKPPIQALGLGTEFWRVNPMYACVQACLSVCNAARATC